MVSGAPVNDFAEPAARLKAALHASALRGLDTRGRSRDWLDWLLSERRKSLQPTSILSADMRAKTHAGMHAGMHVVAGSIRLRKSRPFSAGFAARGRAETRRFACCSLGSSLINRHPDVNDP